MKHLLITLFFVLTAIVGSSQSYYKATVTEFYTYNKSTQSWELYQKNSDVNITVVVEDEFVSFQAKTPSMYKIYENSKEPFNTKSSKGYRYLGKDLKSDKMVKVDILISDDSPVALISIVNVNDGYNFRFFLTKVIE
jgi:hypothetical protein